MIGKSADFFCAPRMHGFTRISLLLAVGSALSLALLIYLIPVISTLSGMLIGLIACAILATLTYCLPKKITCTACAEAALRLDSRQNLNIAAHLPDLVWSIDFASRNVTPLNQVYTHLHPQPSSKENRLATILPARVSRLFLESLIRLQNQQETIRFEYEISGEGKTVHTFEARLIGVSSSECLAIIREISHIKATEEALINQQMFLQQIVDNSPDLIFVRDRHGRFLLVNRATQATLGHELLAQSHSGLPDTQIPFITGDQEVLDSGQAAEIIEKITLPDGRVRWYEVTKLPLVREDDTYLLCIAMDITHFHSSEAAQQSADSFIRAIAESLPTAFLLLDNDIIVFGNRAACGLLNCEPDKLIGLHFSSIEGDHRFRANLLNRIDCAGVPIQMVVLGAVDV